MTEHTEEQLTVDDILAEAQEAPYHTILEIWLSVLTPAREERKKKITPQWANRICTAYRDVFFADMVEFRDRYFNKIDELTHILEDEISTDDECLNFFTPEEDVEHNSPHYLNVLIYWQKAFLQWELDWNTLDADAGVELAAISEVHRMIFDNTGLINLLDNIKFEFTDDDRELLAVTLQEQQAAAQED